jgi:hypothetical protein
VKPNCIKCGAELLLLREAIENYSWQCAAKCLPTIDTGVAVGTSLACFERDAIKDGEISTPFFTRPVPSSHLSGAKVYLPFILYHFIECNYAACYNSIYQNLLVPHLDSISVLDYVLRTPVVEGFSESLKGIPQPKMFSELYFRLLNVKSPVIQQYLNDTFGPDTNGNR